MFRPLISPRRRVLWVALLAVVACLVSLFAAAWLATPTPSALDARVRAVLRGTAGRSVELSAVAPILREAVVATEDERFYRHRGIDIVGVFRAIPYDLAHASFAEGASTISEQLAKRLYLQGNDHDPWRKLEDAALALKLEDRYTKDAILAAYLNSAYFGEGAYGIQAAAERFFAVSPGRLTVAQASLLAGLLQAPSAYDPRTHPAAARARQIEVLRSLVRTGSLTPAEGAAALERPLRLHAGSVLAPLAGIDLSPGPAFVWWELTVGAVIMLLAPLALLLSRLPDLSPGKAVLAGRLLTLTLFVVGIGTIIRSFRVA
jgi:membrane peptidoglycan carboxypeptidase